MGGVLVQDIKLALKGHVQDGYNFNPVSPLSEGDRHYNKNPTPNDRVQVLVCVVPADTLSIMSNEVVQKFRNIREEASNLKIPQLAILTKTDIEFPEVKDLKDVYRSRYMKEKMQKFSVDVGIPMNCIFPVRNYSQEINMNNDINSLILDAMKDILQCADDFLEFTQDQSGRSERKPVVWMEKFSANVGIPMNCIFPVRNYSQEINMNDDIDSLILDAMKDILQCADDYFEFTQDQSGRSERKPVVWMEKFSANVGIPMNCIFPVRNYSQETDMNDDINSLILNAMKHILHCGHDFLEFIQDKADSS
ncbi:interferon-induced protein 44-like [Odontesthes bonariensis]|uniref:interferon-induced protein 44-like n=1 Tax=Odontesthes bonariensis TaxID=219752 RepID=UPI003F58C864